MDELQVWTEGALGRLRLNRPRAINSLSAAMILGLDGALAEWAEDPGIAAVLIDGAGERGLCAGADVRAMRDALLAESAPGGAASGPEAAAHFLLTEYELDRRVATFAKPYVAWMDGIVMGGGLGVSAHGSLRFATPRAAMAMPETIIGFFPDVGVTHLLSRAPGELGTHLALTGASVTGADAVHLGLADRLVAESALDGILSELRQGRLPDVGDPDPDWPLEAARGWIDECYAPTGATGAAGLLDEARLIVHRLRQHPNPAAQAAADMIGQRSPLAVTVALHAVREAATLPDAGAVLDRDGRIGTRLIEHPDFVEGVRAQLVDKDKTPNWNPATLDDLTAPEVARIIG